MENKNEIVDFHIMRPVGDSQAGSQVPWRTLLKTTVLFILLFLVYFRMLTVSGQAYIPILVYSV